MSKPDTDILAQLDQILESRKGQAASKSYVASLYAKGVEGIAKKVGEEATEVVIAAMQGNREELIYETADLWFHSLILLANAGIRSDEVLAELSRRLGVSGHAEKAARTAKN